MAARRALLEESTDAIGENNAAPRRAFLPNISETAVLGSEVCATAPDDELSGPARRAASRPRGRRARRLVVPAAAVLLSSALGIGAVLVPTASADQNHSSGTGSQPAVTGTLPAVGSTASASVLDSSAGDVNQATQARLAEEAAQQAEQTTADTQRAEALAAVGKLASDKVSSDDKAAADKAAADKAAADKAAADKAAADKAAAAEAAAQQAAEQQQAAAQKAATEAAQRVQAQQATASQVAAAVRSSSPVAAPATATASSSDSAVQTALDYALAQVGKPYSYGAVGPDAFDCSGLMLTAYAKAGITLPRTSYEQANVGTPVSRDALQPGDLVFFYSNGHVGMYIGNGQVVHAADYGIGVIVSSVDSMSFSGAVRVA